MITDYYDYARRLANWTKSDEDYFYAKIAPSILKLCRKWQLNDSPQGLGVLLLLLSLQAFYIVSATLDHARLDLVV